MTQSSPPTCSWRVGDSEALRIALSIPVTSAALAALGREMAQLQTHYPTGVCTAQQHLDALAVLDQQLAALTPAELNRPIRSRRKGVAGGVVPNPLPLSKLAVVEYATELLLEETESEWDPHAPSAAAGQLDLVLRLPVVATFLPRPRCPQRDGIGPRRQARGDSVQLVIAFPAKPRPHRP